MIATLTPAALDADPARAAALLALNNAHATELSELDAPRFRTLVGAAFMAACTGVADSLLLAFDQGAPYDSPNFHWFRGRYDRFVYVDRVVVAPAARGRGLARLLYGALAARAASADVARIACEVNAVPPNPASDAFHARLGFVPVGEAGLPGGKTVRYLTIHTATLAETTA